MLSKPELIQSMPKMPLHCAWLGLGLQVIFWFGWRNSCQKTSPQKEKCAEKIKLGNLPWTRSLTPAEYVM